LREQGTYRNFKRKKGSEGKAIKAEEKKGEKVFKSQSGQVPSPASIGGD